MAKFVFMMNFQLLRFFALAITFDNMASKGLRAISYQGIGIIEAGYKPMHTTETLIGYIVCYQLAILIGWQLFDFVFKEFQRSFIQTIESIY
jgi:hypothetical protein